MTIDTTRLKLAVQTAQGAGQLLLDFFQKKQLKSSLKADYSLVTEADLAANDSIKKSIQKFFPGEKILSEEDAVPLQPVAKDNPRNLWVIDPLDGTTNFFLGLPIWGISIAHLLDGEPETAVLYFPFLNELYTCQRHHGSFLNDEAIFVENPEPEKPYSFFSCCSRTFQRYNIGIKYKSRILGSAAYTLCCVAKGTAILGFEATPKIWDLAGGWLLVKEAGGVMETLDGSLPFPFKYTEADLLTDYPTIAAASRRLAEKAHRQIVARSADI